jgi:glutathione synthase/RimK-type ligase-like ATP-grasp enzyme
MEKKGLSIVPSLLLQRELSEFQILEQIEKVGWRNLVLKPAISATAYLTYNVASSSTDLTNILKRIKKHSDIIIQPFISSVATKGEVSLIFFKKETPSFSHAVLKQPKTGDFRVQSDFGGTAKAFQPSKPLLDFAKTCVEAIAGDWTFARVDSVDWEHKPLLSELELIEPDLYLSFDPHASQNFADSVAKRLHL